MIIIELFLAVAGENSLKKIYKKKTKKLLKKRIKVTPTRGAPFLYLRVLLAIVTSR